MRLSLIHVCFLFGLACSGLVCAEDSKSDAAEALIGLWGNETSFGTPAQGELIIDGRQKPWRASLAGFNVAIEKTGNEIHFSLPAAQGEFRGRFGKDGKSLQGFWIQAAGATINRPFASPVKFVGQYPNIWRGEVKPLVDRIAFYLKIERGTDGNLIAFIRNPQFNFGKNRPYVVTAKGNDITFSNTQRKNDQLHALLDEETGQLMLTIQGIGMFAFNKRDINTALGFYPRTPKAEAYRYQAPVPGTDAWQTGTLRDAGFNQALIARMVEQIENTVTTDERTPYIHSVLIARHGKLLLEEYFYGHDREQTHDTRSSGKTLTSALVGLAIQNGANFTLDTPVTTLFPKYQILANPDPRKSKINVRHLLTMSSGLACNDYEDESPGNEDTMQQQHKQPDWYKFTLDLPMLRNPGNAEATYCTGGINLLGGIVANTMKIPLPEFFQEYYARPLNIENYYMNLTPTGDAYGGGGIYLRPRDSLKLGQLYVSGGRWNKRQILNSDWITQSTQKQTHFKPGHDYGFAWHLHEMKVGNRSYRSYAAEGNGGQFVIVIPELDLVVQIAVGNYGDFKTWYEFQDLVPKYIIPAIQSP